MIDSAESVRERKRAETAHALIRAARHATAAHGLAGFTVEDVCEQAGVSRRTFFNYFASKEDAVLGLPIERGDADAIAAFVGGGDPADPALSATLIADLATLALARWVVLELGPDSAADLMPAIEREPRLLARMLQLGMEGEQADAQLIARREGLDEGDLRAHAAAQIVGTIARAATGEWLSGGAAEPFPDVFLRRLAAASALFDSQEFPEGTR